MCSIFFCWLSINANMLHIESLECQGFSSFQQFMTGLTTWMVKCKNLYTPFTAINPDHDKICLYWTHFQQQICFYVWLHGGSVFINVSGMLLNVSAQCSLTTCCFSLISICKLCVFLHIYPKLQWFTNLNQRWMRNKTKFRYLAGFLTTTVGVWSHACSSVTLCSGTALHCLGMTKPLPYSHQPPPPLHQMWDDW